MSRERTLLVRLARSGTTDLLLNEIAAAQRRAGKAMPGDRSEIIRFEALCVSLESMAASALASGADSAVLPPGVALTMPFIDQPMPATNLPPQLSLWWSDGDLAVPLVDVLAVGPTEILPEIAREDLSQPADPWSAGEGVEPFNAVRLRFQQQLELAIEGAEGAAIRPSGVSNRALTEVLREQIAIPGQEVNVPVMYKDGSSARPFPLRGVALKDKVPAGQRVYKFALISIRHTEMDVEVDGAWLRNTAISQQRPAAETDEIAFVHTQAQLAKLCAEEPVIIYLYQTGLDAAIVGTYRAIALFLRANPGRLTVVPMFFKRGRPSGSTSPGGYAQQSSFVEGLAWRA